MDTWLKVLSIELHFLCSCCYRKALVVYFLKDPTSCYIWCTMQKVISLESWLISKWDETPKFIFVNFASKIV